MMNRKLKGFSLAELLISLLIISLVLSAAIPTLTRKSSAGREFIWRWSQDNNSAYFGVGSNQSAIIGYDKMPLKEVEIKKVLGISEDTEFKIEELNYSPYGDKLVLLKKSAFLGEGNTNPSDFANSHLSFYTLENGVDATANDIHYAGRIASNQHNLAFGIGTLQHIDNISDTSKGRNTAIGHYALLNATSGYQNTALGERTISHITEGHQNTAIGYGTLFNLGKDQAQSQQKDTNSLNTAVGDQAMYWLNEGKANTALGTLALSYATAGQANSAVGYSSLTSLQEGEGNVGVGAYSCSALQKGKNNICLGHNSGLMNIYGNQENKDSDYGLFIGSSSGKNEETGEDEGEIDLIMGHTKHVKDKFHKELLVNARQFIVRPHNGIDETFRINSFAVDVTQNEDEYGAGAGGTGRYIVGQLFMNLYKAGLESSTLSFTSIKKSGNNNNYYKKVIMGAYDQSLVEPDKEKAVIDLSFNEILEFNFPNTPTSLESTQDNTVSIHTTNNKYKLDLNGKIQIQDSDDTPNLKLDNNGFDLKLNDDSNEDNFVYINLDKTKPEFSVSIKNPNDNFDNFQIRSQGGGYLTAKNFEITDKKVILKGLENTEIPAQNGTSKLVPDLGENFKSIWEKISELYSTFQQQSTMSDERLKNISGDSTAGLKEINALQVKNYTYKEDKDKTPHVGVIAQQLQKVFPNSVLKGEDGYLRIKTEEIFYAMVNSIKELYAQFQDLTAKVTGLDKRITELEKQNAQLKKQNAEFEKRLSKLEKSVK